MVYPVSRDITEHDLGTEVDEWTYGDRQVFRGNVDPTYLDQDLYVYWLYDDNNLRVGLAEHDVKNPHQFAILWFQDTPFGTLLQQEGWKSDDRTLWSLMPQHAYEDCLRKNIQTPEELVRHYPAMKARLVTPQMIIQNEHTKDVTYCSDCGRSSCKKKSTTTDFNTLYFLDNDWVLYSRSTPSSDGSSSVPVPVPEQAQEQAPMPPPPADSPRASLPLEEESPPPRRRPRHRRGTYQRSSGASEHSPEHP